MTQALRRRSFTAVSIPGYSVSHFWWTKWHWDRCSPSTRHIPGGIARNVRRVLVTKSVKHKVIRHDNYQV